MKNDTSHILRGRSVHEELSTPVLEYAPDILLTIIIRSMYVKCNLWIPQIPVQIVAPYTKLYTIYGNRM